MENSLTNPEFIGSKEKVSVDKTDESTLIKDPLIINRIEVLGPEITYEIKGTTDNFRTIIDNMKKPENQSTRVKKKRSRKKREKKRYFPKRIILEQFKPILNLF